MYFPCIDKNVVIHDPFIAVLFFSILNSVSSPVLKKCNLILHSSLTI